MAFLTFLTSNRFLSPSVPAPALATFALGAAGASVMFTSAIVVLCMRDVGMRGAVCRFSVNTMCWL